MSIKISELPVLSNTSLISSTTATFPVAAGAGTLSTYQTSIGAIKDYVENGPFYAYGGLQNTAIGNVTPSTALFTTVGTSGNTTVAALTVNGTATIGSTVGVTGNINGTSLALSGSATIGTTLGVVGNEIIGGILTVTGNINGSSATLTGGATLGSTLGVTGNINGSELSLSGSATLGSTLGVTGNINGAGLTLSGSEVVAGSLQALGGLQATPIGNASASTGTFTTFTAANVTVTNTSNFNGNINTNNIMPFGNANANIGSTALQFNTVFARSTASQYADLAEKYKADSDYEPGTVVIFGGLEEITVTSNWADYRVAGIISTDPAYLMNSGEEGLPVALRGKVPVKVVGKVSKGDLLISSTTPGYAESVGFRTDYNPLAVVAKSLENSNSYDPRVIMAVVV